MLRHLQSSFISFVSAYYAPQNSPGIPGDAVPNEDRETVTAGGMLRLEHTWKWPGRVCVSMMQTHDFSQMRSTETIPSGGRGSDRSEIDSVLRPHCREDKLTCRHLDVCTGVGVWDMVTS